MDSSTFCNDDEHIDTHLSKSQCLEMSYQEALSNTNLVVKDEGARRLRLRILMLENENDDLHEQLAVGDDRADLLEQNSEELRAQLEHTQEEARRRETELRTQTREVNNLRAEVASMNGVTMDSTKLLTEKLSLARELATLKPELEHLRSQTTYQQTILSEKLALQRQVSTLEVELETEKRATKRAAQKNDNSEKEAELHHQLDALHKDLAREKKEGVKALKEQEKELKAYEARQSVLECKLEETKTKLRAAKEQLKESQTELSHIRTEATKTASLLAKAEAQARKPRKRSVLEISTDQTIGTPDGATMGGKRSGLKRGRMDQTMVGEKSMFSITPFLNRTLSMAPEASTEAPKPKIIEDDEQEEDGHGEEEKAPDVEAPIEAQNSHHDVLSPTPVPQPKAKRKIGKKTAESNKNALEEANHNVQANKPGPKKVQRLSKLAEITEEDVDENEQAAPSASVSQKPTIKATAAAKAAKPKRSKVQLKDTEVKDEEPKKKRKKLLGATLFDEDDAEATKRPAKVSLGRPRLLGKSTGDVLGAPKGEMPAFSPLKKDRRGAGASFLA
ncbi:uncharacterized protein BP5553_04891 [Venustampulla echinocandica]|uniref:Rossmann-fold NAD(P)(+)-binding protein n=1 Tax=Venustampulla echinocandica TaxID=2656787 RepID=A0A370TPL9_9HELO|nr:uncharacterized protein BP5553_04891 [Venustampulla echinocandica]RDL37458.1 hypothetical protein BP5553_04891 [Venustampulla echinocandica]